jgi:hypothetical protein
MFVRQLNDTTGSTLFTLLIFLSLAIAISFPVCFSAHIGGRQSAGQQPWGQDQQFATKGKGYHGKIKV